MPGPRHLQRPPINEVVCGVQFQGLQSVLAPHVGLFWAELSDRFPQCREVPPLPLIIERLDGRTVGEMGYEIVDTPPLPRVWFMSENGNELLQWQRERLLFNWRRLKATDDYPRFEAVRDDFFMYLERYQDFLAARQLGALDINQLELMYVDHIPVGHGWSDHASLGELFPGFSWMGKELTLAQEPESFQVRTAHPMPDGTGRLHLTIRNATRNVDKSPIIVLEMTVRGIGQGTDNASLRTWFSRAHELVLDVFWDITSEGVRRDHWGEQP